MAKFLKIFFFLLCTYGFGLLAKAQVIENYADDLKFNKRTSWFKKADLVQVSLDVQSFPRSGFQIQIPGTATVFLGESLWFYTENDSVFHISLGQIKEHLPNPTAGSVELTVLKKNLYSDEVQIIKGFFNEGEVFSKEIEDDPLTSEKREISQFYDFFHLALIIILFLIAIYKVIYPMVLKLIIAPLSVFSAEDFSETHSLQRFFSIDVIFYVLLVNMLLSLWIMVGVREADIALLKPYLREDLNQLFLFWLFGAMLLFVVSVGKFLFLRFVGFLFEMGKFEFSHYFYLLRIISILVFALALTISFYALNDQQMLPTVINYTLFGFFWVYIAGVLMLFIIMKNRVPYKNYHLFAYLCSAELVPFLVLSKLIIG